MRLSHALWGHHDGRVMVQSSDSMWSMEKGMANHFSILVLRTQWTVWKGKMIGHWKWNAPGCLVPNVLLEISGEQTPEIKKGRRQSKNNIQLWMLRDRSKVQCCKEQHCIGTWSVRSMNQSKLNVAKQEMARVNVDILGISELQWTGIGEFITCDHYIY